MGLDDVLVATHLIDTHEQVLLDDAPPVPVLLDVGGVVLEHILLGLGQGSGVNGGAGVLHLIVDNLESQLLKLGIDGSDCQYHCVGLAVGDGGTYTAQGLGRVGCTGILADLLQIDAAQHLSQEFGLERVLQAVRDLVGVPDEHLIVLGFLHLAGKVAQDFA